MAFIDEWCAVNRVSDELRAEIEYDDFLAMFMRFRQTATRVRVLGVLSLRRDPDNPDHTDNADQQPTQRRQRSRSAPPARPRSAEPQQRRQQPPQEAPMGP
eukprot:15450748-Alexandrium_andersonii.AAC.1